MNDPIKGPAAYRRLLKGKALSAKALACDLGYTEGGVRGTLFRMVKQGLVRVIPRPRGGLTTYTWEVL